jgi:NAD-dependent deacetylase
VEDVATPEAFARDPELVHTFYNARRAALKQVEPNAAHLALAQLEREHPGDVLVVTQNVDNLHERAGCQNLLHMHGELNRMFCTHCDSHFDCHTDLQSDTPCQACGRMHSLRPDIVWFGEMPYHMDRIEQALAKCDLFISIGTSGNVYPAAGFVSTVKYFRRAHSVELNLEPSSGSHHFDQSIHGLASQIVPMFVEQILRGTVQ